MTTTHVMKLAPPQFAPGPVDGAALTAAFATFYQYVLARMDLRYPGNDFGGLGNPGHVLTSTGTDAPVYMPTGFPTVANDTVVGNVSGGPAQAVGLTQAQLTALVNLVTNALSGAIPAYPNDATKFFNGVGAYAVPAYPVAANPSANVGLTAVDGTAATFMSSDSAPPIDQTIAPTWTGQHNFTPSVGEAIVLNALSLTPAIHLNTQASTGAKTATFTSTNKPGTNNKTSPDTWVWINLDGTAYLMPAFLP